MGCSVLARCWFCGKEAVTCLGYARLCLCSSHFRLFIEKRFRKCIERYGLLDGVSSVLSCISGGKDSVVASYLLYKLSREYNYTLYLLYIDLGIRGYSSLCRSIVEDFSRKTNTPLIVVSTRDLLGYSVPEIAEIVKRSICSVCGLVKRYLINTVAIELGVDTIATGHNLDDIASYILKEFLAQRLENLAKLIPKTPSIEDIAVSRIKPLYELYEDEIRLYADLENLPYTREKCPYTPRNSLEKNIKKMIAGLEREHPGIILGFIRSFLKNIGYYPKKEYKLGRCSVCGLISSRDKCSYCRLTEKLLGKPYGAETRSYIRALIERMTRG